MDTWFTMVIRQLMLYSLPLMITLTSITLIQTYYLGKTAADGKSKTWLGTWLPLSVCILFGRAVIFALPKPISQSFNAALLRFSAHTILCIIGFVLYSWALSHPPLTGLPPLHHWWAKVLMYLNLCLMALHLLPLPNMVMGEYLHRFDFFKSYASWFKGNMHIFVLTLLAATPLLDLVLGGLIIFPIYEQLASFAE